MSSKEVKNLCVIIGKRLKVARNANNLTQGQVAEMANISTEYFGRLERGHAVPRLQTLSALAHVLDIPLEQFFAEPEDKADDAVLGGALLRLLDNDPKLRGVLLARLKSAQRRAVDGQP